MCCGDIFLVATNKIQSSITTISRFHSKVQSGVAPVKRFARCTQIDYTKSSTYEGWSRALLLRGKDAWSLPESSNYTGPGLMF